ncbi:elongation factor P [Candidatus Parcubacteria bacterium]|nr:MAG: elongation factor P [Candidatus Parcubacteria bacterium]
MIPVTDLRTGVTFEEDGQIFQVISYEHIKMGRGSANVKAKVKNLRSGATTEKSYISNAHVRPIHLEKKDAQFLYKSGDEACFMDLLTFEQYSIPLRSLSGYEFLKEGEVVGVQYYKDEPLALLLSPKVTLEVFDTDPGIKGNSATNVYKDAVLENGIHVKVPLFIQIGDKIVVDTRDGSYTKRA